jgi:two-component system nitrogen regulation sensor histidine kinase NtrY
MSATAGSLADYWLRLRLWARQVRLSRKLAYVLAAAAVASGVATVFAMTGPKSSTYELGTIVTLLYLDAILLLLLAAVVARKLVVVWFERRRGRAGAGLHIRLVVLFSLVAITPAILVAIFSAMFLNHGMQVWFSERVSTAIGASNAVARAYLIEHRNAIRTDALALANELNRLAPTLMRQPGAFDDVLSFEAARRSLPEALVVDGSGRVLARSALSLSLEFGLAPSAAIESARRGEIAILTTETDDRVRAVVALNRFVDAYLLVGRFVDPKILEHIQRVERAAAQYQRMQQESRGIQISFVAMFVIVAMLLLLAAAWIGLTLATQLAQPISNLIDAAERVSKGDLSVRVDTRASGDELGTLTRAFNRMTSQIETQRDGLVEANRQLDERRRFTETVLTGVSAGVIGLDKEGRIHLPNRSASELLAVDFDRAVGRPLGEVVPEMERLLTEARLRPERLAQAEVRFPGKGRFKTFLVRIAAERIGNDVIGYVVTFDDVTELLSAQRTAAWADVARRIAHEIKNPLTPIQLSAERLRRKYLKEIKTDPEVFATCTETIVRQVEEFSSFARMPQASIKPENLSELCRQAVFLERNRHPDIEFALKLPAVDVRLACDSRQVARALTNVLKNAAESIAASRESETPAGKGWIQVVLTPASAETVATVVVVEDNGKGLPKENRDRLTEPYVTTRTKGTGLGLAIVKKIMEDHNGELILADREGGGARVSLVFRPAQDKADTASTPPDPMAVATSIVAHGS